MCLNLQNSDWMLFIPEVQNPKYYPLLCKFINRINKKYICYNIIHKFTENIVIDRYLYREAKVSLALDINKIKELDFIMFSVYSINGEPFIWPDNESILYNHENCNIFDNFKNHQIIDHIQFSSDYIIDLSNNYNYSYKKNNA